MNALGWRLAGLSLLLGLILGGRGAWLWQANDYSKQLSDQSADYDRQLAGKDLVLSREREVAAATALDQLAAQQEARRNLEGRLHEQAQIHWKEMNDAQQTQARLRDSIATADVRLSILVATEAVAAQSCDARVRQTAATGSLVHGAVRVELDSTHARRIIAITDQGDRGIIALRACQGYIKSLGGL